MNRALTIGLLTLACGCSQDDTGVGPGDAPAGAVPDAGGTQHDAGAGGVPDARPAVLTQHNDNRRTGANLRETTLDTSNVKPETFGKLFTRDVDGHLYAQPLVAPDLDIDGKRRNVVFLATMHNSVYAFDADDPDAAAPLWHVNLGTPVPTADYFCRDIELEDGITSTPVIDLASSTIYVSVKHLEDGVVAHSLHALDLQTGAEKLGGPIKVSGSVRGMGWSSADGDVQFNPGAQHQRPALLLSKGRIYLAYGSNCDKRRYHGWVIAYDASTLTPAGIWNVTPDGARGGIWMSGQGPSADEDGNVYLVTGNGDADPVTGTMLGEAFVKLSPSLELLDWFIPHNYKMLNEADLDLGSAGVLLVPGSSMITSGGKEGVLYVLDSRAMGRFNATDDNQIPLSLKVADDNIHGAPVYWQGPTDAYIYVWPEETYLKAFRRTGDTIDPTPAAQSTMMAPNGMPGGILSISANGSNAGSAIVWATLPLRGNAIHMTVPGIVRAFDATDLRELWNSEMKAERDSVGSFAKFSPATVVNGKVYMSTFSGKLVVYGLLP
jgi:outer membrane protein assembly factor BamB